MLASRLLPLELPPLPPKPEPPPSMKKPAELRLSSSTPNSSNRRISSLSSRSVVFTSYI
jgi:hypothetical protein